MLTRRERDILSKGFQGPRPGSNAMPLLELRKNGIVISGERIDELERAGVLVATPRDRVVHTIRGGDAGPYGEIPDIELSFNWHLKE